MDRETFAILQALYTTFLLDHCFNGHQAYFPPCASCDQLKRARDYLRDHGLDPDPHPPWADEPVVEEADDGD